MVIRANKNERSFENLNWSKSIIIPRCWTDKFMRHFQFRLLKESRALSEPSFFFKSFPSLYLQNHGFFLELNVDLEECLTDGLLKQDLIGIEESDDDSSPYLTSSSKSLFKDAQN